MFRVGFNSSFSARVLQKMGRAGRRKQIPQPCACPAASYRLSTLTYQPRWCWGRSRSQDSGSQVLVLCRPRPPRAEGLHRSPGKLVCPRISYTTEPPKAGRVAVTVISLTKTQRGKRGTARCTFGSFVHADRCRRRAEQSTGEEVMQQHHHPQHVLHLHQQPHQTVTNQPRELAVAQ